MAWLAQEIVVDAPRGVVYDQWTQFEDFPAFMESIDAVTQLDERRVAWSASIGGRRASWEAQIVEQVPDRSIAWRSIAGPSNAGVVTFEPVGNQQTAVRLELTYEPRGFAERIAASIGLIGRYVERDLHEFKDFIEARREPTGAWRGQIDDPEGRAEAEEMLRGEARGHVTAGRVRGLRERA